jgi:transposase-like protein
MEADELRRALAEHQGGRGKKFPSELRDAAVTLANRSKQSGKSFGATARDLGLNVATLANWRAQAEEEEGEMTPVELVADELEARGTLIVEYGPVRVSGLALAEVAELLRMLT